MGHDLPTVLYSKLAKSEREIAELKNQIDVLKKSELALLAEMNKRKGVSENDEFAQESIDALVHFLERGIYVAKKYNSNTITITPYGANLMLCLLKSSVLEK